MVAADTIEEIASAATWDERVSRIRQVPQKHGTDEHPAIYAAVAQRVYVPQLAPDFAYVHAAEFYESSHFEAAYERAFSVTDGFTTTDPEAVAAGLVAEPTALLVFRTILGLTKGEFAASTALVADTLGVTPLSASKVDKIEKEGSTLTADQAMVAATTIHRIMQGTLFGEPEGGLRKKQRKPDTMNGWATVRSFAEQGVPYSTFLHQRHYGGAFRQVLDATSEQRGNLIEDAVEQLFREHGVPFVRTGSHDHREIEERFEVAVRPAPDFVVYDNAGALKGLLECKGANDGGTARDKALRFAKLREESIRLGGVPLLAVLSGLGWTRVNDTLGPVVRDCDGRVFTLANLQDMLTVQPFPALVDLAPA